MRALPRVTATVFARPIPTLVAFLGVTLLLSGSGPSLFAVADSRQDALRIARILRAQGLEAGALELGVAGGHTVRASAVLLPFAGG